MKTIEKKIVPVYYKAVESNDKLFELRKDEDDIQTGDTLILREWDGAKYTGRALKREVTYVLRNVEGYGLMDGYCIIGLKYFQYGKMFPSMNINVNQHGDNCRFIGHVDTLTIR